jgi:predicted nuclease of predicted toxin-antitoxin system
MITYLIDENMPFMPFWDRETYVHVNDLPFISSDTDIWDYAFQNQLIIITKDTDFYYRYLSSKKYPKVVWIKIKNIKKNIFIPFVESIWNEVEEMLLYSSFVIVNEDKIEGF